MNSTKSKREIIIQGNVSELEIEELNKIYKDFQVHKLLVKGPFEQDFLQVVFLILM